MGNRYGGSGICDSCGCIATPLTVCDGKSYCLSCIEVKLRETEPRWKRRLPRKIPFAVVDEPNR